MKLLLVASCLVAGAMAGTLFGAVPQAVYPAARAVPAVVGVAPVGVVAQNPVVQQLGLPQPQADVLGGGVNSQSLGNAAGQATDVDKTKAYAGVRDLALGQQAAQNWLAQAKNYGRDNGAYGDEARNNQAKQQLAASRYGARSDAADERNAASQKAAENAATAAFGAHRLGAKDDSQRLLNDQVWAQGNQFYKGRRNNDDIDYAYDKKFDLRDSENGGFEFAESANSHALDDLRDASSSFDRNTDTAAAWASAADAQKAARQSASAAHSSAADANRDKFARNQDSAAKAHGRNQDWSQKLDSTQGGNRLWTDARKSASDIYKDLATADGSYMKNAKALANKQGVNGDHALAYGLAGKGGIAVKPGYAAAPGGARALIASGRLEGDAAAAWDQAAKAGLRNTEGVATQDRTKTEFSKDQWLSDRNQGFDRQNAAHANDAGFNDWAKQAARSANKADAANAAAAQAWNRDQNAQQFNEDIWKKDAARRQLSDRDSNHKIYKKYFNNKNRGGDNWERLKYDRDQADDVFGYDTAAKKDFGQQESDLRQRDLYNAKANNAHANRANAAQRTASDAQQWKNADGHQGAQAANKVDLDAYRTGFKNQAWKQDQAQQNADANSQSKRNTAVDNARLGLDARINDAVSGPNGAAAAGGFGGFGSNAFRSGANLGGYPGNPGLNSGLPSNFGNFGGYPGKSIF